MLKPVTVHEYEYKKKWTSMDLLFCGPRISLPLHCLFSNPNCLIVDIIKFPLLGLDLVLGLDLELDLDLDEVLELPFLQHCLFRVFIFSIVFILYFGILNCVILRK